MAKYRITAPDGNSYEVTAPDTASQDEVLSYAKMNYKGSSPKTSILGNLAGKYANFMGKEGAYGAFPAGKAMSLLQKLFDWSGENIAEFGGKKGYPKTGAGIGTAVQMAPQVATSFMTGPESGPPEPGPMTKGLFGQLESASGGMKGSLEQEFKHPMTIFGKGSSAAKPSYQAAMKEVPYDQTIFRGLGKHGEIVDKAIETIEKGGKIEPQEALIARKSLDKIKKTFNDDSFNYYRQLFDRTAKQSEDIAKADPAHRIGMMSESLRKIMPQNKYGGTSAFKMTIVPALSGIGGAIAGPPGAVAGGGLAAATLSPAVQGFGAGTMGTIARTDPRLITTLLQYLRRKKSENIDPLSQR